VLALVLPSASAAADDVATLPAGARLSGVTDTLPPGIELTPSEQAAIAERDGTVAVLGVKPTRRVARSVVAAVRDPAGAWRVVSVDTGRGIAGGPAGSTRYTGVMPTGIVAGPDGFVALGRVYLYPGRSFVPGQAVGLVWTSEDGLRWRRSDLRDVLGDRVSFVPRAIAVRPGGGFVIVGSAAPLGFQRKSTIVVLSSQDGRRWRRTASIGATWSLTPARLHAVGDRLLLTGFEFACDATSEHQRTFSVGAQLRAWVSAGDSWDPVPLASSGVITAPNPAPSGPRGCRSRSDLAERESRYRSSGRIVGSVDGALIATSDDGATVAVSRDLVSWTTATLPGTTPSGEPPGDRGIIATQVVPDATPGGIALLSLERRRDADDQVEVYGHSVITWRSLDDGVTWERLPSGRARLLDGVERVSWEPTLDQAQWILRQTAASPPRLFLTRSEAGPPEPSTCTPEAGADCAFTVMTDLDLAGRDLVGIDLSGARLDGANLDGADLGGADLRAARIAGSMRGTRLVDVRAERANLEGDVAGADLTGADLSRATITGSSTRVADARGLDLRPATLDSSSLIWLDLTGARIGRAQATGLSFIYEVICPDGEASTDPADPDPCRLTSRP
jgi:hypothetical protein